MRTESRRFRVAVAVVFVGLVVVVVLTNPETAWAQTLGDLGEKKLTDFRAALKDVGVVALGVAGILGAVYVGFGRQDGNEKIGAVIKGGIILSMIVSAVGYLAG